CRVALVVSHFSDQKFRHGFMFTRRDATQHVLIDWISDVLVRERIIVKDLVEDLYDGQVLQKLFENLEGEKLNVAEVTQCEITQKQKLQTVLEKINDTLKISSRNTKWNVDSVYAKNIVAILHLLVALFQHFRAPIRLPDHVSIQVVVVQVLLFSRDAFDTLFDHAPDKLNVVKKFADGMYLVLLMGLLEGYFMHNVLFSFELMQDGNLEKAKPRPEDIVNCDLKSTLRVLYNLFTKYRNVE
uniref:Parvin, alpha b n=1 Tax=Cyprinus carpio TaxID=7962 RepID=A0A8C2DLE8_CYPCA